MSWIRSFAPVSRMDNALSFLDTGLETNTVYHYRVKAANWQGDSAWSSSVTVTTLVAGADVPVEALAIWLRAEAGHGGAKINLWPDQSGQGWHAFQPGGELQPVADLSGGPGSRPTIRFEGTNELEFRFFKTNLISSAEVFIVVRTEAADRDLWGFGSGASRYPRDLGGGSYYVYDNFFRSNVDTETASFQLLSAWHLYNATSTSGGWNSRINAQAFHTYSRTQHQFGCPVQIPKLGYGGGGSQFQGAVTELLLFRQALTADERSAVELYLNGRYPLW